MCMLCVELCCSVVCVCECTCMCAGEEGRGVRGYEEDARICMCMFVCT